MADSGETDSLTGGNMDAAEKVESAATGGAGGGGGRFRVVGDEPWISCAEVAKAVGLSPKTVYRLANAGIGFPVIPLGGVKRFVLSEVKAFLRGNPEKVAEAAAAHTLKSVKGGRR